MKRQRLQLVALQLVTLAALALSCEPELSREEALAGKPCAGEADCVEGYECSLDNFCVPSSSVTSGMGGANGGTNAGAGNGNEPGTSGSSAGGSSAGGGSGIGSGGGAGSMAVGSAGNPGNAGSGSLGGPEPDAGAPPDPADASTGADGGCTPVPIFRDRDGDGFGSVQEEDQDLACSPPDGFVTVSGDCFDGPTILGERAQDVHPGQTEFFIAGYHPDPNEFSVVSFDYDCSGTEDRDPTNSPNRAAADCSQVSLPCGSPNGYEPSGRSGNGVDILCGSEFTAICVVGGNGCEPLSTLTDPFRCH